MKQDRIILTLAVALVLLCVVALLFSLGVIVGRFF